jgi:RHS repeat-associated protein
MRKPAVSSGHRDYLSFHGSPGRAPWVSRPVLEGTLSGDTYTTLNKYVWEGGSYYDPLMYSLIGGSWRYHMYDGLGSTRQLLQHSSPYNVTDTYQYEAFGNLLSSTGSTANPYRYVGSLGYYQTGNDLMHLGARYYMPEAGRFIQRDPLPFADNQYGYVDNDPSSSVDAAGARPVKPNDPRFPQHPSHGWVPVLLNKACIEAAVRNAYAITNKHFPGTRGELNGPEDAYRHCVWACLVRKTCGGAAYNSAVIDHENSGAPWARGHWDPTSSPMDLANDEMGRKMSCQKGSCESRCADAYHKGLLYVLPKSYWSP